MLLQKRNAHPEWVSNLPEVTQQGQGTVRVENQVSDCNVIRTLLHFNELFHDTQAPSSKNLLSRAREREGGKESIFVERLLCARSRHAGPRLPTPAFPPDLLIFHLCLQPLPCPPFYNKDTSMAMTGALAFHLAGEEKWGMNSGNLLLLMWAAWLNSLQVLLIKINHPGRSAKENIPGSRLMGV